MAKKKENTSSSNNKIVPSIINWKGVRYKDDAGFRNKNPRQKKPSELLLNGPDWIYPVRFFQKFFFAFLCLFFKWALLNGGGSSNKTASLVIVYQWRIAAISLYFIFFQLIIIRRRISEETRYFDMTCLSIRTISIAWYSLTKRKIRVFLL